MSEPLEMLADVVLVVRNKIHRTQAKLTAREDLGFQFALAEENPLPNLHFAARPNQRFPSFGIDFAGEKDFDFSCKVLRFCGTRWWLRMDTGTLSEQAGRDDPGIVQDEQFVASQ